MDISQPHLKLSYSSIQIHVNSKATAVKEAAPSNLLNPTAQEQTHLRGSKVYSTDKERNTVGKPFIITKGQSKIIQHFNAALTFTVLLCSVFR